jgi:uncharacterized protein YgiM (DUF1202 family)
VIDLSKDNKKQWNNSASQGYMKKACEFIGKNKRYVIAAGALVCFVLILFFAVGKGGLFGRNSSSGDAARFAENKNKDVEKLIRNYYDAYAKGDVKKLSSYAVPISPNEAEYIKLFGGYIKDYTIKKIYSQQGIDGNSCCVTVEIEIEFEGVTTKAPGLDFFYITGLQTGTLYINNLYSQFNLRTGEYVTESQIDKCINKFENRPEMKELQEKIQKKYEEAILKDEKLDILINETINTAVNEWMDSVVLLQNEMPPAFVIGEVTDDNGEGEGEDEPDEPEEDPIVIDPELEIVEYAITTAEVNVRYGASTEKRAIGKVAEGAKVTVLAIDPWGEWSYVQVNDDLKGFIRNDFLITQDNEESITGLQGYPDKDDKIAVSEDVDLMNSMKSYGKVITRLMTGTQVTVIMVYRNGFAKVSVNGKIGYLPITSLSY